MPEKKLLRALLTYIEASLGPEGIPVSDNPEKPVDTPTSRGEDPAVPPCGMTANEFRAIRRVAGVTMVEAARLLGVTERTILRWEHGATRIDPLKAEAIRLELRPLWERLEKETACRDEDNADDTETGT